MHTAIYKTKYTETFSDKVSNVKNGIKLFCLILKVNTSKDICF